MDRMVKLFTVAFWKAHLDRDTRYTRFLTRGYSNQEPEAAITRIDDETDPD
jgi:hypothetical protein